MKKRGLRSWMGIACALAILFSLCGCGEDAGGETKTIDKEALAAELAGTLEFRDMLEAVDSGIAGLRYDTPENVEVVLYAGSGATAEEVAVFEAPDEDTAEEVLEAAEIYIQDQIDAFENYVPEEVPVLEKAVVEQRGKYVIICVTDDDAAARKKIEEYFD